MKKIMKFKYHFLAFLLPFLLCIAIFYFKNVLLNVENIFVTDLRIQHFSFFHYLKCVLLGEASPFYSFSAGMGSPMLATIIFYVISPINLLLLLIKDIQYAILFIYIIKVSLAGLTMFILLKNRCNKSMFATVLFASCYALCSFAINYFFCIFWFDVLYLAPLVVLGIDKIFNNERINLVYIFSLALAIICNIQMGFGLCVFAVVYYMYSFNIRYDIKKDFNKFKSLAIIFVVSSLCAGAISSGVLIGFMNDYHHVAAARDIHIIEESATTNLGYVFKNMFTVGNYKSDYFNNFEPFIYCGIIVSFFSILYFFNKDIESKKKFHALMVILIFIISFSIKFINLFWHLSSPVLLNYRYSVFMGLFLTVLAYECYLDKDKLIKKDIIVMSCFLLVGLSMIVAFSNEVYVGYTFVFLILIYALILLSKNKSRKFEIGLFGVIILEIFFNGYLSIYTSMDLPYGRYASYKSLSKLASKNDFDDTYRVLYDYSYLEDTNDTFLLNKNSSLRYFSSVIDGKLLTFLNRNLSFVGNNNYKVSAFDSPLLLSLLGTKYLYLTDEFNKSVYKRVDSYSISNYDYTVKKKVNRDVYLYDNPYALSLGYVIDKDVKFKKNMDVIDYQNSIIKAFTGGNDDVLIRLNYVNEDDANLCGDSDGLDCAVFRVKNNTDNKLIYVHGLWQMYHLDERIDAFYDTNKPLLLSTLNSDVKFALAVNGVEYELYSIYTYNRDNLVKYLTQLQENMFDSVEFHNNTMKAHINSSKSGILFLSIPYDNNFKVYVDGKKVKYYSVLDDTFMGLDIEEGEHNIRLEYVNDGYMLYIFVSLISVVITVLVYYFGNRFIMKKKKEEEAKRIVVSSKNKKSDVKKNKKVVEYKKSYKKKNK